MIFIRLPSRASRINVESTPNQQAHPVIWSVSAFALDILSLSSLPLEGLLPSPLPLERGQCVLSPRIALATLADKGVLLA